MICIPNTPEIDELRKQYNKKYKDHMTEHQFIALLEAMMSKYSAKNIPDNLSAINKYYKEQRQKDAEMERLIKQPKYYEQGFSPAQSPAERQALYAQEQNREMEEIKQRAIADGTFMKVTSGKNKGKKSNLNERQWLQVRTKAFKKWFGDWENDPENASKVVDENGEPLVVYHGSKAMITEFNPGKSEARQELSKIIKDTNFFSDDKTVADAFAHTDKQGLANAIGRAFSTVEEALVEDEDEAWDYVAKSVHMPVSDVKHFWLNELSQEQRIDASDGVMYDPEVEKHKYQVFLNMNNPVFIDAKGERADKVLEDNKDTINDNDEVIILNIDETVGKKAAATDYLVRNPNQIKSATDNVGTFSTEDDNIFYSLVPDNERRVLQASEPFTRESAQNDPETLYVFTDNTNRDSGNYIINKDSWYYKKYGDGHDLHFPSRTTAVLRGLENARPVSTQRYYQRGKDYKEGRWTDASFDEFKRVIDDEFDEIKKAWDSGKFKRIVLPGGDGFFNSGISAITRERVPRLYDYLMQKYTELLEYVDGVKDSDVINEFDQTISVAPYFRQRLTTSNKEELERATAEVKEKAIKLAKELGLEIDGIEVVGGTYLGESEITYQYFINSGDQATIDLFAALMGDLGMEYQDSVIAANYVTLEHWEQLPDNNKALEITFNTPEGTTTEEVEALLNSAGIAGSTYHFDNGELTITAFSEDEVDAILSKIEEFNNNPENKKKYEHKETNLQNSRFLENADRRAIYKTWLDSHSGQENRKLHNACSKALAICEAAAQFPDVEDKEHHKEEQKAQEAKRKAAADEAARTWSSDLPAAANNTAPASPVNTDTQVQQPVQDTTSIDQELEAIMRAQAAAMTRESNNEMLNLTQELADDHTQEEIRTMVDYIAGSIMRHMDRLARSTRDSLLDELADPGNTEDKKARLKAQIAKLSDRAGKYSELFKQGVTPLDIISEVIKELGDAVNGDTFYANTIGDKWANEMIYYFDPLLRSAFLVIHRKTGIEFSIDRTNLEGDDVIDAVQKVVAEREKKEAEQNATPTQEQLNKLAQKYKGAIAEMTVMEEPKVEEDNPEEANQSDAPFFDVRKENPYKSLAPAIRMLLSNVSANEQDGFRQQRMLDPEFVYAALMDLLSKEVNNPEDFYTMEEIQEGDPDYKRRHMFPDGKKPVFHALEKYRYKYRWMPALIKTLTDDFVCNRDMNGVNAKLKAAGMEPMETQFGRTVTMLFTSRKEFVPFTTLTEDGTLVQVNELTSDESVEKVVMATYNTRTMLTRTMIYDKEGKVNLDNVKILLDGLKPVSGRLGSDEANNQFLEVIYAVNTATANEYGELLDSIGHYWALDDAAKAEVDAKEKAFNEKRIALAKQMLEDRFGEWGNDNRVEVFKSLIEYTNTLRSLGFDVREEDVFQGTNEKGMSRIIANGTNIIKNILTRISSDEFMGSGVDNIYAGTDQKLWESWKALYEQMDDVVYASQHSTSTREHGKERYSFMPANEITRQWKELTHMDVARRRAYIAEKWGNNPFFRDQTKPLTNPDGSWNTGDAGWRNMYLELQWEDNPRLRLTEEMKADIIANKGKEFEDWNGTDIAEMQLALYAKGITSATGERNNALYMLPIFADSPVCKALGGRRYTVDEVVDKMTEVAMQEVDRIQGVARELALREYAKVFLKAEKEGKTLDFESLSPSVQDIALEFNPNADGITAQQRGERYKAIQAAADHNPAANFADGKINNGLRFQFIPELNDYVVSQAGGKDITVLDIIKNNTEVSGMDKMTPAEIRTMLQEAVDKVLARKYNDYFARFHSVYGEQTQKDVNQSAILHAFKQREFYLANPGMGGNEYIRRGKNNSVWIYVEDGQPFWRANTNGNGGRMVISRGEWFYLSGPDDAYLQKLSRDELDIAKEEERLADTRVPIKEGNFGVIAAHNAKGWGVDRLMRDMWYNSTFANSQIIQLMFGDIAYAKNFDDFQKRWKALYAGGMQLDYNCIGGRREYNMVILKDNKRAISSSYGNIYKAFDNAVKEGRITEAQRDQWCASYHQIDATDAQGLRSLDSFRRLLKMAGKWTTEAEQSYQRITHDKWTSQDLEFMVQTIKPVYMGSNQQTLPGGMVTQVPMYIKNSEAVLLTLFKAIQVPYSPTLKALDRVQKAITYKDGPNAGQTYIDAFQYETAVKLGGQGAVDLRYSRIRLGLLQTRDGWPDMQARDSFWQWRRNREEFKGNPNDFSTITYDEISQWAEEALSAAKGNDEVGKTLKMVNGVLNFLDYSRKEDANQQQKWENEMVDILNGAIYMDPNSDEINPEVVHQLDNNCLVIQQPTPHHPVTGKVSFGSQLRYLMPIDLPDDIKVTLMRKLPDGREVPETYDKPRLIEHYNRLIVARALKGYEEANSVFADIHTLQKYLINIVKDNPRYGDDMLNALEIVEWTDEQGQKHETFALPNTSVNMVNKLEELFTAVYRNKVHKQKMHGGSTILMADMKYSDELEVRFKDGHLEGVECWLPASAKDILESCGKMNDKGEYVIDPKDLQREGMDKIVGYRIPTDDKHSMLPLIVKGFLPPAMGSALVVSKEIIIMTGGDNDVDKLYLFTHHYTMNKRGKMVKVQYDSGHVEGDSWVGNLENNNTLAQIENEIIDVCYKILTNDKVSDKLFKPQDYEGVRDTAMMIQIINDRKANAFVREEYVKKYGKDAKVDFMNLDRKIMKKAYELTYRARSPIYPETYSYYHNQNSSGKAEVGIFANNSALNAKLQDKGIMVKDKYVITVNKRDIREVSPMFIYAEGKKMRVSDNCSELLGAAADTAKDPLLARMGITKNNAAFAGFMVRMGLTLKETGMLISIYKKHGFPEGFGKTVEKLRESGVNPVIDTRMLEKVLSTDPDKLNTGDEDVLNVLYALYNLKDLAYNLRQATIGMQADSPNHALETDFASAIYYKYATIQANRLIRSPEFPFDFPKDEHGEIADIIPINGEDSFEKIMSSKAPVTQAYHTLGISKALENISRRSIASDPAFDDWMTRLAPYLFTMKKDDAIKIIRALYREYITFYLSRLPMFNEGKYGGFIGNRQWFKYQFPLAFQKWVSDSGIKNNIALSRIQVDIDNRLTIDQESVSQMTVPYIFAGLDALWQETGNGFADDTTERCARALLKYCYFANGLTFSFGDIANFFSVSYLSREGHFDEYIEALAELEQRCIKARETGESQLTPTESDRYFTQFMRNNASRFRLGRVIVNDSTSGIPYKELAARVEKSLKTEGKAICQLNADEERRFTDGLFYRVPVQDSSSNVDPITAALGGAPAVSKYDIYECRLDGDKKILVKIADGLENDKWYYHGLSVDDMNRKEEWYHPGVKADTWYRPVTTRQLRKAVAAQQRAEQNQKRQEELSRDAVQPDANDTTSQGAGVPDMIPPEPNDVSTADFDQLEDPDITYDDERRFNASEEMEAENLRKAQEQQIDGINIEGAIESGGSKMENPNDC